MNTSSTKPAKPIKRRTRQQWQSLMDQFSQSPLSVVQFCHENKLSVSSFYQWRTKLSQPEESSHLNTVEPSFIDLEALSQASDNEAAWHIVLKLGGGVELCLSQTHVPA